MVFNCDNILSFVLAAAAAAVDAAAAAAAAAAVAAAAAASAVVHDEDAGAMGGDEGESPQGPMKKSPGSARKSSGHKKGNRLSMGSMGDIDLDDIDLDALGG